MCAWLRGEATSTLIITKSSESSANELLRSTIFANPCVRPPVSYVRDDAGGVYREERLRQERHGWERQFCWKSEEDGQRGQRELAGAHLACSAPALVDQHHRLHIQHDLQVHTASAFSSLCGALSEMQGG